MDKIEIKKRIKERMKHHKKLSESENAHPAYTDKHNHIYIELSKLLGEIK